MSYVLQHVQKGENPRCYSISPSPAMYWRAKVNRLYMVRCFYAVPSIYFAPPVGSALATYMQGGRYNLK